MDRSIHLVAVDRTLRYSSAQESKAVQKPWAYIRGVKDLSPSEPSGVIHRYLDVVGNDGQRLSLDPVYYDGSVWNTVQGVLGRVCALPDLWARLYSEELKLEPSKAFKQILRRQRVFWTRAWALWDKWFPGFYDGLKPGEEEMTEWISRFKLGRQAAFLQGLQRLQERIDMHGSDAPVSVLFGPTLIAAFVKFEAMSEGKPPRIIQEMVYPEIQVLAGPYYRRFTGALKTNLAFGNSPVVYWGGLNGEQMGRQARLALAHAQRVVDFVYPRDNNTDASPFGAWLAAAQERHRRTLQLSRKARKRLVREYFASLLVQVEAMEGDPGEGFHPHIICRERDGKKFDTSLSREYQDEGIRRDMRAGLNEIAGRALLEANKVRGHLLCDPSITYMAKCGQISGSPKTTGGNSQSDGMIWLDAIDRFCEEMQVDWWDLGCTIPIMSDDVFQFMPEWLDGLIVPDDECGIEFSEEETSSLLDATFLGGHILPCADGYAPCPLVYRLLFKLGVYVGPPVDPACYRLQVLQGLVAQVHHHVDLQALFMEALGRLYVPVNVASDQFRPLNLVVHQPWYGAGVNHEVRYGWGHPTAELYASGIERDIGGNWQPDGDPDEVPQERSAYSRVTPSTGAILSRELESRGHDAAPGAETLH